MKKMNIAIASDHAGLNIKLHIIDYLKQENYIFYDYGTYTKNSTDYPDYAHQVAIAVEKKEFDLGIVVCGSGNGVNMVVNKYQSIRSALCWKKEIAHLARLHNDANICALPGRFIDKNEAITIIKEFLNTEFEGGRHLSRVKKIAVKDKMVNS